MKTRKLGHYTTGPARTAPALRGLIAVAASLGILLLPLAGLQGEGMGPSSIALAGNGNGNGNDPVGGDGDGDGGGGNAGSGKGGSKGNGGKKPDKGDLYGDMIYVKRDVNGVPLLDTAGCLQPIAWDAVTESWVSLPLYWEQVANPELEVPQKCTEPEPGLTARMQERLRLYLGQFGVSPGGGCYSDCDQDRDRDRDRDRDHMRVSLQSTDETELDDCDVIPECADDTEEVELGRLSVLRAPVRVLDKARDEVFKTLLKSGVDPTLDATGRLTVADATFDSPLVNLALYREFHLWWQLQDTASMPIVYFVPGSDDGLFRGDFTGVLLPNGDLYDPYLAMAFGLAAGADKYGSGVDEDVVVRSNAILHLPGNEYHVPTGGPNYDGFPPPWSVEIDGTTQWFINYSDFSYDRTAVFPGCIKYDYYDLDEGRWYFDVQKTIIDAVFDGVDPGIVHNIEGFALAADDARRVLTFVHDIGDSALRGRVDPVFTNSGQWCP